MSRPTFTIYGTTYEYATEEELLEFANTVRKAGGANVIEAFMPSTPGDSTRCLIANALNFSCRVGPDADPSGSWVMRFPINLDPNTVAQIAIATDGTIVGHPNEGALHWKLYLPDHIGNAAWAFDIREGWTRKYNRNFL